MAEGRGWDVSDGSGVSQMASCYEEASLRPLPAQCLASRPSGSIVEEQLCFCLVSSMLRTLPNVYTYGLERKMYGKVIGRAERWEVSPPTNPSFYVPTEKKRCHLEGQLFLCEPRLEGSLRQGEASMNSAESPFSHLPVKLSEASETEKPACLW